MAALAETIAALRQLWQGGLVTYAGEHVHLTDAACTPTPATPPRIVVGVGGSRRLIRAAVTYADELNLYADPVILDYAREQIAAAGRSVALSIYLHWPPDQWPADLVGTLAAWAQPGISRVFVSLGYDADLAGRAEELAAAQAALTSAGV
jgi:alkanesulfonate monooxygenase SsuD/methylene tetrahydromethanopterin reductase-like flavin-dependent oxidoreductase (luciferase family)